MDSVAIDGTYTKCGEGGIYIPFARWYMKPLGDVHHVRRRMKRRRRRRRSRRRVRSEEEECRSVSWS